MTPRRISCGCCAGIGNAPDRERCCCWIHQDARLGIKPHVCGYHALTPAQRSEWEALDAAIDEQRRS
jgi:hypothetical protein